MHKSTTAGSARDKPRGRNVEVMFDTPRNRRHGSIIRRRDLYSQSRTTNSDVYMPSVNIMGATSQPKQALVHVYDTQLRGSGVS